MDNLVTPLNPEGPPNFATGCPASYWIWYDKDAWHLRTSTVVNVSRFTGTIKAKEGAITDVNLYNTDKKDAAQLENPKVLRLDLYTKAKLQGVDFKSTAKCLSFDLKIDGKYYSSLITVGKAEGYPNSTPFSVCRPEKEKPATLGWFRGDKSTEKEPRKEPPPAPAPAPGESPKQLLMTEGKPKFGPLSEPRYWLWHDEAGWHLRTTTAGQVREFSGRIFAREGNFENITSTRPEGADFKITRSPSAFEFVYKSVGAIDGLDWQSRALCLEFQLSIDGKNNPDYVRVGMMNQGPMVNPFTLCQQKPMIKATGKPRLDDKALGFTLWQDEEGWHLRTTAATKDHKMEGTVLHPGGGRGEVQATRETRTEFALSGEDVFSFNFKAHGKEEGFDWKPTNACAVFDLKIDGEHRPNLVYMGSQAQTPEVIPFGLCK
jgi:hypothetical protein